MPFVELLLGVVLHRHGRCTRSRTGSSATLPFILLFQFGFLYAGVMSLFQNVGKLLFVREQAA